MATSKKRTAHTLAHVTFGRKVVKIGQAVEAEELSKEIGLETPRTPLPFEQCTASSPNPISVVLVSKFSS